jgi:hypothetical protein
MLPVYFTIKQPFESGIVRVHDYIFSINNIFFIYKYSRRHFVTKNIRTLKENDTNSMHEYREIWLSCSLFKLSAAIFDRNLHVILMAKNWTLKGHRAKPWRLVEFRPQKANLGNKGFSIISKMYEEN